MRITSATDFVVQPRQLCVWVAVQVGCCLLVSQSAVAAEKLTFNRDIRPILSDKCFACHGYDPKHREAGLRLDQAEGAYGSGESGETAITPGNVAESEVWKRITATDESVRMPPAAFNKTLSPAEVATLKQWIEEGADYQIHWAFEAPMERPAPQISMPNVQVRNPIDAFIAYRLTRDTLSMSPEADKPTLIPSSRWQAKRAMPVADSEQSEHRPPVRPPLNDKFHPPNMQRLAASTIRDGDWKLIYYHANGRYELFNLKKDLGETTNLADWQSKRRNQLAARLGEYLQNVKAQMPNTTNGQQVAWPGATNIP